MNLVRVLFCLPAFGVLSTAAVLDAQNAPVLVGRWEGTLIPVPARGSRDLSARGNAPRLPTVVVIKTDDAGAYIGTWASTRQAGITEIGTITIDGDTIHITVPNWRGEWDGKLSADGTTLDGTWRQSGGRFPLVLKRVAAE